MTDRRVTSEAIVKKEAPATKMLSCRRERAEVRDVSRGVLVDGLDIGPGAVVVGMAGSAEMPERWRKAITGDFDVRIF
jgi:hypothetical protein